METAAGADEAGAVLVTVGAAAVPVGSVVVAKGARFTMSGDPSRIVAVAGACDGLAFVDVGVGVGVDVVIAGIEAELVVVVVSAGSGCDAGITIVVAEAAEGVAVGCGCGEGEETVDVCGVDKRGGEGRGGGGGETVGVVATVLPVAAACAKATGRAPFRIESQIGAEAGRNDVDEAGVVEADDGGVVVAGGTVPVTGAAAEAEEVAPSPNCQTSVKPTLFTMPWALYDGGTNPPQYIFEEVGAVGGRTAESVALKEAPLSVSGLPSAAAAFCQSPRHAAG